MRTTRRLWHPKGHYTIRLTRSRWFRDAQIWASPWQRHHAPVARQMIGDARDNRHASQRHREIEKKLTFSPDVSSLKTIGDISPKSRRTFGEVHQGSKCRRHIGDASAMLPTCLHKYRRCIFDVILSPTVWVIHRTCSRTVLRSICYAMAMLSPACSIFSLNLIL